MTFDIDKAISERFQKAEGFKMFAPGDGIYRDTASMRTLDESQKARKAGDTETADRLLEDYNDNLETLYDSKETHVPNITPGKNGEPVLGKPIKAPGRPDAIATKANQDGIYWKHPMMRQDAVEARGEVPGDEEAWTQAAKQMNRKTGRSKRDLDTAVTEVAIGENPKYHALPPGRSVEAFIDRVVGHVQAGMSFEDALDLAAEDMAGRSLRKSFDIDRAIESIQKAGGNALVDTYEANEDQYDPYNMPGMEFANPDDSSEYYNDYWAFLNLTDPQTGAPLPFESALFDAFSSKGVPLTEEQIEQIKKRIAGRSEKKTGQINRSFDVDSAIAANQPTGRASPEPVRPIKGPGQRL